jgi:hypothetical protein
LKKALSSIGEAIKKAITLETASFVHEPYVNGGAFIEAFSMRRKDEL